MRHPRRRGAGRGAPEHLQCVITSAEGDENRRPCALTADGTPYCWGNGEALQVNTNCPYPAGGVHACVPTPTALSTPSRFTMIAASSLGGMCGTTTAQEVACWGVDIHQRFGTADPATCYNGCGSTPVVTRKGFTSLSASAYTTCAIATNQRAYCWGDNGANQISPQAPATTNVPTLFRVPGA